MLSQFRHGGAVVTAQAETETGTVESSNICGYQHISIPKGFSLYTVTFKNVGGGEYDVQNIIPYVGEAQLTGANQVTFQKCDKDGYYGTTYGWIQARGGWCQGMTKATDILLASGEAVCFNSKVDGVTIQVSGEVELIPISKPLTVGYNLVGNMNPCKINIQDIIPYDGESQLSGANQVTFQKCDTEGNYGTSYGWLAARGGWCQGMTKVTDVFLEPGEAFCINCKVAGVVLTFKSPVATSAE